MTHFVAPGEAPVGDGEDPSAKQPDSMASAYPPAVDGVPSLGDQTPIGTDGMKINQVDPWVRTDRTEPNDTDPLQETGAVVTQPAPTEALPPTRSEQKWWKRKSMKAIGALAVAATAATALMLGVKASGEDHQATPGTGPVPTAAAQSPNAPSPSPTQETALQPGNIQPEKVLTLGPTYTVEEAGKTTTLPKLLVPGATAPNGETITPTDTVNSFLAQYQRMLASNQAEVVDEIIDNMVDDPNGIGSNIANKLRSDWQRMQEYRLNRTNKGFNTPAVLTVYEDSPTLPAEFALTDLDAFGNHNIEKKSGVLVEYFYAATRPDDQPSGKPIAQLGISQFRIAVSEDGRLTNIYIQELR